MNLTLRPYQIDIRRAIAASYRDGHRAPCVVLPTGGGKTAIFSSLAEAMARAGRSVQILVHRDCILRQTVDLLTSMGLDFGVIAPGHTMTGDAVQVSSVYTLARRLGRVRAPELVIIDECHHATASTWSTILSTWRQTTRILGVTATPARLDGNGLGIHAGGFFDDLLIGPDVATLTASGYLAPAVIYVPPSGVDMSGVHIKMGDFVGSEAAARVDKPTITGDAIEHYRRICPGAPAVAFCANVQHSENVARQFTEAGFAAASIDGKLPQSLIDSRLRDLATGVLRVITSCNLISEGFDLPHCVAAIGLRPTQSLALHLQQWGRVLRTAPGKTLAVILDHVGNIYRHGPVDMPRQWTLDGAKRKAGQAGAALPVIKYCEKCYAVISPAATVCPQCGAPVVVSAVELSQIDGTLVEFKQAAAAVEIAERKAAEKKAEEERIERVRNYRKTHPIWVIERAYEDGRMTEKQLIEEFKAMGVELGYPTKWAYGAARRSLEKIEAKRQRRAGRGEQQRLGLAEEAA